MSQAELARRVGVQQSTMNALVRGKSRSSREIVAIARELRTTPEYLQGDVDDPAEGYQDESLTFEERNMLTITRALPESDRQLINSMIFRLANGPSNDTLHDRKQPFFAEGEKRNGTHG